MLPAILACLLLLLWFAPALIGGTGLKDVLIGRATQGIAGRISVGAVRLGWLTPLELRETTVDDADGNRMLDAALIRTDRTLLQLLTDQNHLGQWTVQQARIRVATKDDTSNLEHWIASLPAGDGGEAASVPQVQLTLVDCQVEVLAPESDASLLLTDLQGSLVTPAGGRGDVALTLTGVTRPAVAGDAPAPFQVSGRIALEPVAADTPSSLPAGRLELQCRALDLATLRPLLARLQPDLRLHGMLTVDAQLDWEADAKSPQVELRALDGTEIQVVCPSRLGAEPLRLPYVRGQGGARLDGDIVTLRQLNLDCRLARIEADGRLSLAALQSVAAQSGDTAALASQQGRLLGHVDLALVAATMPQLLRVREDTRIESGLLQLEIVSRGDAAGHTWTGRLISSELSAMRGNQRIVWPQPLELTANIQQNATGLFVERLQCQCTFLQLEAAGTLDRASLQATADLDQLVAELDRFLDLREVTLQGKVRSQWQWLREPADKFRLSGDLVAENLRLSWPGSRPWQEPQLELTVAATGVLDATPRLQRLDSAVLTLRAANGDQLTAQLSEPVSGLADMAFGNEAPGERAVGTGGSGTGGSGTGGSGTGGIGETGCAVAGTVSGDLSAWVARLQTLCPLPGYDVRGTFAAEMAGRVRANAIEIASSHFVAENLHLHGQGLFVDEPRLEATARASWELAGGRLDVPDATLATSAVSLRATETLLETGGSAPSARGRLALNGDLHRMLAWVRDPTVPPAMHCDGQVNGRMTLSQQDGTTFLQGDTVLTNLVVRQRGQAAAGRPPDWTTVWQEPRLALEAKGEVQAANERLVLEAIKLEGSQSGLACQAKGSVEQWSKRVYVDMQGELTYDLEQMVERLRDLVGPQLQLSGKGQRSFQLQGPLLAGTPASDGPRWVPAELTGQASVGWEGANYLGMQVGPGQLQSRLRDARLDIDPLDLVVSQGRLLMKPHIDFRRDPALLVLEPGQVIQQMQISPEMCRSWLKFVAPLLADATRAEGQFSLDVQQATLPLGLPRQATLQGKLVVHSARVGPGPLAQQLLTTADQMQALLQQKLPTGKLSNGTNWISMPAQSIDVQMIEGRVYHRGLQLVIDDIIIQTEGSVGLDETIQMEAQVPIRQQWLDGRRWLAGLQGHVVRIPIRGTLSKPRVDERVMQNFASQTLKQAAGQALQQELGRGLKQLFGPSSGN